MERKLDARLRDADDPEIVRRLGFIKNLYRGDTFGDAADQVGKSQPTGARWAERWNDGGLSRLAPDYDGMRPSRLRWGAPASAGPNRGRSTLDDAGSPSPPIAVSSIEAFCPVVRDVFDRLTEKVSIAANWIERFLNIQKLSEVLRCLSGHGEVATRCSQRAEGARGHPGD